MSETIKISVDLKLVPAVLHSGLFFIHFREKKQQQLYFFRALGSVWGLFSEEWLTFGFHKFIRKMLAFYMLIGNGMLVWSCHTVIIFL